MNMKTLMERAKSISTTTELATIRLCESLPSNMTFFETNGKCTKQSKADDCNYSNKQGENYLCNKQACTAIQNLSIT